MKREDLRVMDALEDGVCCRCGSPAHGPVSDADLAALGYYKLDVDVESLREGIAYYRESNHLSASLLWVSLVAQVLDAFDGEETT